MLLPLCRNIDKFYCPDSLENCASNKFDFAAICMQLGELARVDSRATGGCRDKFDGVGLRLG